MATAPHDHAPILSVALFRDWLTSRPNEEHWELIAGVPMLKPPATLYQRRITSNLDLLLNTALEAHAPALMSFQRIGINIAAMPPYDPEPDLVVIERPDVDGRYFDRFFLVGEILSDEEQRVMESKRAIYQAQPTCQCILLVRRDRVEVTVDQRSENAWQSRVLDTHLG